MRHVGRLAGGFTVVMPLRVLRRETDGIHPTPRPDFRRSHQMRHQRRKKQRRSGRILAVGVVVIAAVAIAGAVILHNRSSDSPRPTARAAARSRWLLPGRVCARRP